MYTVSPDAAIIDIGGGASMLVDDLMAGGFSNLTVLDLSLAALSAAQARLGQDATRVQWKEVNIINADLPDQTYDVWHDRAVFHFLTMAEDRKAYFNLAQRSVKKGGYVIIATFAEDGPTQCSELPVIRYSVPALQAELGSNFTLIRSQEELHGTPFNTTQKFIYCLFQLMN